MGFFKDLSSLTSQAREIEANSPPVGERLQGMSQQLAALNSSMADAATLTDPAGPGVDARIQVITVAPSTGSVNNAPMVDVTVNVLLPGRPPVPVTASIVVPVTSVHRLQPGATLAARVDPANPAAFAINWMAPA